MSSLKQPIVFLSIHTTGLNQDSDRIVELSAIKYNLDGKKIDVTRRFNPGIEVPQEATQISGISTQDVLQECRFSDRAYNIYSFIYGCDLVGFNLKGFIIPFLKKEFSQCGINFEHWGGNVVDIFELFLAMEPRNFSKAVSMFCGEDAPDILDSSLKNNFQVRMLSGMMKKYPELNSLESATKVSFGGKIPLDFEGAITYDDRGFVFFNVGKHKNESVQDVCLSDRQYIDWILVKSNFSAQVKNVVRSIFEQVEMQMHQEYISRQYHQE